MADSLAVGQVAPDFSVLANPMPLTTGTMTILYFFPKVFTPVCTTEACAFRDMHPFFEKLNVQVVGISADSPEELAAFQAQFQLPFPLLSDADGHVSRQYQAWNEDYNRPKRLTFALLPSCEISAVFSDYGEDDEGIRLLIRDVKKHILSTFTV